ncbi:TetR/AcrR family transcriptional regulator [Paucibacter sp. APW11]|uniref:TetR/AcrR family transcriptional regulator n=1 Tax=Roseateles aquae TaxID=3077235 RepID=A0ABU3PEV3_9BURK|nr:TetR/AcrR family transcriptional regulator [Paucibacter sp. APW11]MDT9000682.1 TetR/AcrR family transcriptional regulator [Paucibacter sp. APW11]
MTTPARADQSTEQSTEQRPEQIQDDSPTQAGLRLSDRKRQAIVRAAVEEFRSQGFARTSMDGVAAAAGVSKRTVYNHFPSKEELFAEILGQLWQRAKALAEQPYRPEQPLREQLHALLAAKLKLLTDPGFIDLARVGIAEMLHTPERARQMVERMAEKEQGLAGWIAAAQQHGRLKVADADFASQQLQGLLKSAAFWPQLTMGQPALTAAQQRRLLDETVEMFLSRYASDQSRAR